LGTFALPQFGLAALLTGLVLRALEPRPALALAYVLGHLLCWLGYMLGSPVGAAGAGTLQSFVDTFRAVYLSELWSLPATASPWLGIAAGLWWARRGGLPRPPVTPSPSPAA